MREWPFLSWFSTGGSSLLPSCLSLSRTVDWMDTMHCFVWSRRNGLIQYFTVRNVTLYCILSIVIAWWLTKFWSYFRINNLHSDSKSKMHRRWSLWEGWSYGKDISSTHLIDLLVSRRKDYCAINNDALSGLNGLPGLLVIVARRSQIGLGIGSSRKIFYPADCPFEGIVFTRVVPMDLVLDQHRISRLVHRLTS